MKGFEEAGFMGKSCGPGDTSLMASYGDHVVKRLWHGKKQNFVNCDIDFVVRNYFFLFQKILILL